MEYFYTILKTYIDLIQNQRKSSIDLSIQPNSMQKSDESETIGSANRMVKCLQEEDFTENDENDEFTPAQIQELELENYLIKELDATLEFKEKMEEYVYDNFLPFLKYFNMKYLRNMFM